MSYYLPGFSAAYERVQFMTTAEELYTVLDELYGRGNLPDNPTPDDIRFEALAQIRREYTDTESTEHQMAQLVIKAHKAGVWAQ